MAADSKASVGRRRPGRPRDTDPAATREQILEAATRLFSESGFRGTSMVAIAHAADLSQTGLNHHYGSKEALLAAVLDRRDRIDAAVLDEGRAADDVPRGWEILDWMARLVERNSGQRPIVRLFTAMLGEAVDADHPAHDWLRQHYDAAAEKVRVALQQAVDDGTALPDTPVDRIVRNSFALMDGLQVQWLLDPERVDMVADFAEYAAGVRERWLVDGAAAS